MTGPRNRRALLRTGALALSAGLAGCGGGLGDGTGDVPDSTTTETETPPTTKRTTRTTASETTAAEPPLVVEDVRVQSSFVHLTTPDSAGVAAPEGTQFVFAEVAVGVVSSELVPPSPDGVSLAGDDWRFNGTTTPGPTYDAYQLYRREPAYDLGENRGGWVAFEVPNPLDASEVALTYESNGRTFSEPLAAETVAALAEPPAEFELVGFDAPESVEQYESFEVSVAVENASERDGVFRAVLNQTYPTYGPYPIEGAVPAGERREWTETFSVRIPDGRDTAAAFRLLTPGEKREAAVEAAAETTDEA